MKTKVLLGSLLLLSVPVARAQYAVAVVSDPIAQVNHVEDIAKWTQSIATLNQQLQQMQQSVALAQQLKTVVGDPAAAAGALKLQLLGAGPLTQAVGQLTATLNQTVDGAKALANSGSQLFTPVELKTPSGLAMTFDPAQFKAFAAIQNQEQNVGTVLKETNLRIVDLQAQKAATLAQIQAAPDQSTVQKLTAQLGALDGQIAVLGQQQQAATDQMLTQQAANQNDRALKAQAANQAADQELSVSLQNFTRWQGQITRSRTEFK